MNGIHDLGGMQGFGSVDREPDEPVFHAPWEAVMVAIQAATRGPDLINIDEFRHGIERMDPAHYLASAYYEHWLDGITRVAIEKGILTRDEIDARTEFFRQRPDAPATAPIGGPLPERALRAHRGPLTYRRETGAPVRFSPGDAVRTKTMHPRGHTRLPRYARGKRGVVDRVHGTFVFPDTNAHGMDEQPQPVYSVRFDARELWGEAAEAGQSVHLDLWESYLAPV